MEKLKKDQATITITIGLDGNDEVECEFDLKFAPQPEGENINSG